ncbi:MAG: GAF domain-containing protein [Oscillatoriales cyanobacterium]|nr:MAG: GAF domain-containing protein [Oscillatoriales cyanobacterium]TAD97517.1 MAG: GAF domain-containing protein [Oscillatoriales cyanobacterium]TAE06273.1 MAG: GAF domain-containing protein [Oscillatoriales cyanobacterium]
MTNYQGSQDCDPIDRSPSESCMLQLQQITEPVSVQKFLDRIMQYQVDPAQIGRQICQIIATSIHEETLLLQIANTLGAACQADYCLVAAVSDNRIAIPNAGWGIFGDRINSTVISDAAVLTHRSEIPETEILNSLLISLPEHLLVNILTHGEILGISDIQDDRSTNAPDSLVPSLPFRAILASPTRFRGGVNGIVILATAQPQEWSATSRQCLELASDAIANAISHIQKTQEIAHLNQKLEEQAKYKKLLDSVIKEIEKNAEIDLILQQVIASTSQSLEVDRVQILSLKYTKPVLEISSLHLPSPTTIALVCEYEEQKVEKPPTSQTESSPKNSTEPTKNKYKTTNNKTKITNSISKNIGNFSISESSLCQSAFHSAPQSFALADAGEIINQEQQKSVEILKLQDTRSLVLVPLIGARKQETVLGFLLLQHSEPRTWQIAELEVLESIATQVTRAILEFETFQELQTQLECRNTQLANSLDVQEKLHEESTNQLEQIRKLRLIQDEFLSVVSHELRTPLTIMKLAIMMLKQADQPLQSRIKYLDILEQQCSKETDLVSDLLALKQLDAQQDPMFIVPVSLKSLIQDLAEDFEQKWTSKGLTLAQDFSKPLPRLETDKDSLHRILLELLTNAGKYSAAGTEVTLEISQASGSIVMKLSNFGGGISAADLPHIFEKFRRGTGITQQAIPGTGLGLALVKCLVQHLNGTIEVSSSPSEILENDPLWRTSFTLNLPQFPGGRYS